MVTRRKIEPWERYRRGRNSGVRGMPKPRFLIVCEGEKTEPNYFKSFEVTSASISVIGTGRNTIDLVRKTINLVIQEEQNGSPYTSEDQVWCVFDKDSFSEDVFMGAIKLAHDNNFRVAYTNEAFELWYLLHYTYSDAALPRQVYKHKLSKYLGREYQKNDRRIYDDLYEKQGTAKRNAYKLMSIYSNHYPAKDNPSTTVHLLVEELNKNR